MVINRIQFWLIFLLVCAFFHAVTGAAWAQTQPESKPKSEMGTVEKIQKSLSETVQKSANRLDNFFGDEQTAGWESNDSRVRLRLNTDFIQDHGTDVGGEVSFHIVLPGLGGRFRLVANDEDQNSDAQTGSDFRDDSSVALRYLGLQTKNYGLSYDLGLRIKDDDLSGFGRINSYLAYGLGEHWAGRSQLRLYYYTDTHGRADARQYFERSLSPDTFFRARTRVDWRAEEGDALLIEQRFTLFHKLDSKSAIAYEALGGIQPASNTVFDPDEVVVTPKDQYKQAQLRLRYRRNVKWPWFFVEFWPIVAWPEERDYDTVFAARLRFEVVLGKVPENLGARLDE